MGILTENVYLHDGTTGAGGLKREWIAATATNTLAARVTSIGATVATLEIYGTETISSDVNIPANITVIMKAGSKITISGSAMPILYIGRCICEGPGPHFSIDSNCWLLFGSQFMAPPTQIFEGTGFANVRFGLGNEFLTDTKMQSAGAWTLTGANWAVAGGVMTGTGAVASGYMTQAIAGNTSTDYFWSSVNINAYTSGRCSTRVGNTLGLWNFVAAGAQEGLHKAVNTNDFMICGVNSYAFNGTINAASCRLVVGGLAEIRVEWWGAIGDGRTNCAAAIQAAMYVAGKYFTTPMPRIVKFGPGTFMIGSGLLLVPYCGLAGDSQSTTIKATAAFSGSVMITNDATYGGYTETGNRSRMRLLDGIKLDSTLIASDGFYLFKSTSHLETLDIFLSRFEGNPTYQHIAMYFDSSTGANHNSMHIDRCNIKACKSYTVTAGVVADLGAVYFNHGNDMQNIVVSNCDFNCPGRHIFMSGANNTVRNNNFQATPYPGIAIANRGSKTNSTWSAITAGANTVLTWADAGLSHPWVNTDATYRQVYVVFAGGTGDWAGQSGLYIATFAGSTNAWTITLTGCVTTGYSGSPTCTAEFVGGFTERIMVCNNNHILSENYFDGANVRLDVVGINNTSVAGSSCLFVADNNKALYTTSVGEFLNDGTDMGIKFYSGTYAAKNQFTLTGNQTSAFLVNNYCWVYQYTADHVYGAVRCQITGSSYGAVTTVTIADQIVRSDTTILAMLETTAFKTNDNYWLKYLGTVNAQI
jgi:Pectate lyase superfamily protein